MLEAVFNEKIDTLTVIGLTQWDRGRKLYIKGLDLPPLVQVHFADKINTDAVVMAGTLEYNYTVVEIPNIMLETTHDIYAWVYVTDEQMGMTLKTIVLKVKKRAKPQDYESENPAIDDTLSTIIDYVNKNIEDNEKFYADMQVELKKKLSVSSRLTDEDIDAIIDGTYVEEEGDEPPIEVEGEPISLEELDKIFV